MVRRSRRGSWLGVRFGALLALAVLALAPAPVALGASFEGNGALGQFQEGAAEEATTSTATSTTSTTGSETTPHNSGSIVAIVVAVVVALLLAVGFVIFRDARKWAPAGDAELLEATASRHSPAAMQKRRAKAKAARKQRKRNR
jgi:uncharacterized protein HemX